MRLTVRTFLSLVILFIPTLTAWGCGAGSSSQDHSHTAGHDMAGHAMDDHDMAMHDMAPGPAGDLGATLDGATDEPGTADIYVAGLEKTGAMFTVRLLESMPVPKDTGLYTWTIELVDAQGEPVSGATIVAEPTMPSHGHGTFPPTTEATALDEAGRYELVDMDLFMAGIWQVALFIEHGDASDEVMYHFDLEG